MGSLDFTAADVGYCVTCAEKEAKERMRAKAHHIIEKMMAGIFQGDMARKIAADRAKRKQLYSALSEALGKEYHTGNLNSREECVKVVSCYVRLRNSGIL